MQYVFIEMHLKIENENSHFIKVLEYYSENNSYLYDSI